MIYPTKIFSCTLHDYLEAISANIEEVWLMTALAFGEESYLSSLDTVYGA